jgi:hypothetical protein
MVVPGMWGMVVRTALLINCLAVVLVLAQGATNACAFCFHDLVDVLACSSCHDAHCHHHEDGTEHQHRHEHTCKSGAEFNLAPRAQSANGLDVALCVQPERSLTVLASALFAAQPDCDASPPNLLLRPFQLPTLLC